MSKPRTANNFRPWLAHYPDGVAADIDSSQYHSIGDVFAEALARYGSRPAFSCMGRSLTYRQLDLASYQFACYLKNHLRLPQGARVALMLPNTLQYPIAMFGILRAGLVVVNINPMYTAPELQHQLTDSGAEAIVVIENVAHLIASVQDATALKHVITTGVGDQLGFVKGLLVNLVVRYQRKQVPDFDISDSVGFNTALARAAADRLPPVDLSLNDIAFLQYTGGTTGVSKGAMLTHGNIVSNMLQAGSWLAACIKPGRETVITALPLYHIFALTVNCMVFLRLGAHNILITDPRDMRGFVRTLAESRFSVITGVNTLFNGLMNTEGFAQLDFSTIRLCVGGGAAVQRAVAERWQSITGATLIEGYGLTETSPACMLNAVDNKNFSGAIGPPLPGTDARVCDESGKALAAGEEGELWIKGPQVMLGYWQRPADTAKTITPDGWLKTGDVARMDANGQFFIVDRKKDLILVSGFNVYPNEVEAVLAQHSGVLECAVIGVPDGAAGEAVKAVVVRKDPSLSVESLRSHCAQSLTPYKRPKFIEFIDALPKSSVGKILRRELRAK